MYVVRASSQTSNSTCLTIRRKAAICGCTVTISASTPSIGIDPFRMAEVCGYSATAILRRTLSVNSEVLPYKDVCTLSAANIKNVLQNCIQCQMQFSRRLSRCATQYRGAHHDWPYIIT